MKKNFHKYKTIPILIISIVLIFPFFVTNNALAVIVHDTATSATTGSGTQQTLSWSHSSNGTDRIVVVGVSINANVSVASISYGGLPLTKITALENGNAVRVSLWYRINPPTGSQTITVNMSSPARFVAGAHSYTGVNQQVPFGTAVTSRGNTTVGSLTVPSNANEIVLDVIARRGDLLSNAVSAGAGQNTRWNNRTNLNSNATGVRGAGSSKAGNISTTMLWTWPSTRAWAMAGISLKPAQQTQDITPPLRFNGQPSGVLPSGTTEATLSLQTDEIANCRYDSSPGTIYSQMTNSFGISFGFSHTKQLSNLVEGLTYTFYIRCADQADNRNGDDYIISFSVNAVITTDTEAPSTPNNVSATPVTFSHIDLSWDPSSDNVGVVGYKIYRDGSYYIATDENSYQDINLGSQTTYSYEVTAYDLEGNESPRSAPVEATTHSIPVEEDTEAPTIPDNLVGLAMSDSEVSISWDSSVDNIGVAGYQIYRDGKNIASTLNTSYTDSGLIESTTYNYWITAFDATNNESGASNVVVILTFASPPQPDILSPQRFNGLPSDTLPADTNTVTLSLETDENAICKYSITEDISFDLMTSTFEVTGSWLHQTEIVDLASDRHYQFTVRCRDTHGNANDDDYYIQFSTLPHIDSEPPTMPDNLEAITISSNYITLSWAPSTDNVGIAGYKIYRDSIFIASTLDDQYSDSGLMESTLYYYTVSAFDAAENESAQSNPLIITTTQQDTVPPTISNLTVNDITLNSANISWYTDEPSTTSVEYGFTTQYGETVSDSNLVMQHDLTLSNLSSGAHYNFRVQSADQSNNTAKSINQTFSTLYDADTITPSTVIDLRASDIGHTFLKLSWTAPGDDNMDGSAAFYDIRFSINPINDSTWAGATALTGITIPAAAGMKQQYIVVGLSLNTKYYFALRSTDDAGNISALSNVVDSTTLSQQSSSGTSGGFGGGYSPDTTPPAQPALFQSYPAEDLILLQWENPPDDDFVRVVIVRKETVAPTSLTDGLIVYEGTKEEFIDTSVVDGITYYYGILAYDRIPNYSAILVISTALKAGVSQFNLSQPEIEEIDSPLLEQDSEVSTEYTKTTLSSKFRFSRSLYFGLRGSDVGQLQTILARNQNIYPRGIISQFFGDLTRMAVRKFQCSYGLVCTGNEQSTGYGRVGPRTKALLNGQLLINMDFVPDMNSSLVFGMRGEEVRALQEFLARDTSIYPEGLVTGYFGTATRNAVKKFQCTQDIICSGNEITSGYGKVGPKTSIRIKELLRLYQN